MSNEEQQNIDSEASTEEAPYRAGFVTFVGRPNVGKSTLTNALVGEKIVITSDKPQTTRRAIRGIVHRENGQIIIVDTPGIHRPRTLLGQRLNDIVEDVLSDVDIVGFCVPANEPIGPGDRMINEWLDRAPQAKKVALVTKCETVPKPEVAKQLMELETLRDWDVIIPVSSNDEINLEPLIDELIGLFPESPQLYPDDMITEETYSQRVAELIRESALHGVHDELPHSIAVVIEDMFDEDDDESEGEGKRQIFANIYVERDSQKGIIIGKNGARLKNVRQFATKAINGISDRRVNLTLHIKVAKDWQRDAKQLGRLGF